MIGMLFLGRHTVLVIHVCIILMGPRHRVRLLVVSLCMDASALFAVMPICQVANQLTGAWSSILKLMSFHVRMGYQKGL